MNDDFEKWRKQVEKDPYSPWYCIVCNVLVFCVGALVGTLIWELIK